MGKKFVTIKISVDPVSHLFKDMGGIPYALAKYHNYEGAIVCLYTDEPIHSDEYEKWATIVNLKAYNDEKKDFWVLAKWIWQNAKYYDIMNFYHGQGVHIKLAYIAKLRNPKIKIYFKLDMDRPRYEKAFCYRKHWYKYVEYFFSKVVKTYFIDLFTVETKKYAETLGKLNRFHGKLKCLPNGVFTDIFQPITTINKEKIILTVGRLGTIQKNTEMLIEALILVGADILSGWKVYLVGTSTKEFEIYLANKKKEYPFLNDIIVKTGNIDDKVKLNTIYARSSIFVLPSRFESWGLVVPEAMYFGCYPIMTKCCDACFDYMNTEVGTFVENEDVHSLKQALHDCLTGKIDYKNKSILAHNKIKTEFNWLNITEKLKNYLDEC